MIVHVVANGCTVVAMANAVTVMYVLGIAILSPKVYLLDHMYHHNMHAIVCECTK